MQRDSLFSHKIRLAKFLGLLTRNSRKISRRKKKARRVPINIKKKGISSISD